MFPVSRRPFKVVATFGDIRYKCGRRVDILSPCFSAGFVGPYSFAYSQARNVLIDSELAKITIKLFTVALVILVI